MQKLAFLIISGALVLGTVACQDAAQTSADAPDANAPASPAASSASPDANTVQSTQNDAQSAVRRAQLNSDIRANEQRNNMTGGDANRTDGALESEVRSKLEANIQKGLLAVQAQDGVVTVSGTVPNQQDLSKIEPLAKEIKGVQSVVNKATVAQ